MVVDFASFHLLRYFGLKDRWELGILDPSYANMLSVAIAIQWNFVGNWFFTFSDRGTSLGAAWWRFVVFSSSTWVLNNVIVGAFNAAWGKDTMTMPIVGAIDIENAWKVIAIAICTFANFWLSNTLAFREQRAATAPPGTPPPR